MIGNLQQASLMQALQARRFNTGGIGTYLSPLVHAIQRDYHQDKIEPYMQEVENLTTSTFPDFEVGGVGMQQPLGQMQPGLGMQSEPIQALPAPQPPSMSDPYPNRTPAIGQPTLTAQQIQPNLIFRANQGLGEFR